MRPLNLYQDANGSHFTNIITPSDEVNHIFLPTIGTEKSFTVPANADYVIFQSYNEFFVSIDTAASVPSSDVTDGSGSIPVPLGLFVKPAQVLHIVSSEANARISMMFFKRG